MAHENAVNVIPLKSDRITSGDRGTPELNFDFLNEIQSQTQTRLGTLQNRSQGQHEDLSSVLESVNVLVKDTRKRKRDSDLMFTHQANELNIKSDQIRQSAMEAAADPFNELKALFGDTPSMAEWAARHNVVQNELSAIKRRFTASTAGYNFSLDEAAGELQFAQQKLALTQKNITSISTANQAIMTNIQTRSAMFTQQLNTIHRRVDLKAELDDPNGTIPKDLVRRRLLLLDLAEAELKKARTTTGKSQLELTKQLFDVLTQFPELIPVEAVRQSLETSKPVHVPLLGVSITPQMAKILDTQQVERTQLDAKLLSDLFQNQIQGQQAFEQVAAVLGRTAGPGANVFARDAQGNVSGFNPDALPAEMRQDAAVMFDLQNQSRMLQNTLADPNVVGPPREQIRFLQTEINRRAHELRNKIVEKAKEDAQLTVEGKEAKKSASHFAEFGTIKSIPGSQELLIEGATSVIPGTESILSTAHGAGWGDGLIVFGTKLNNEIKNSPSIFDEAGDIDIDKVTALSVRGIDVFDLAFQEALGQVDAKGNNMTQAAILSDWYEITLNRGIRELEELHAAEPETVAMLQTLRLGIVALDPSITTLKGEDGQILDTANVLFASLALKEKTLREAGTLPDTSALVRELQGLILGDTIGDPEKGKSIYDMPEIILLTTPTTKESASLNFLIFRNRAKATFQTGLQNIVRNVPLDDAQESVQLTQKLALLEQKTLERLREQQATGVEPAALQEEMLKLQREIEELESKESPTSLTGIMQQILSQQE